MIMISQVACEEYEELDVLHHKAKNIINAYGLLPVTYLSNSKNTLVWIMATFKSKSRHKGHLRIMDKTDCNKSVYLTATQLYLQLLLAAILENS